MAQNTYAPATPHPTGFRFVDRTTGYSGDRLSERRTTDRPVSAMRPTYSGAVALLERIPEDGDLDTLELEGARGGRILVLNSFLTSSVVGEPTEAASPGSVAYVLRSDVSAVRNRYDRNVDPERYAYARQDVVSYRKVMLRMVDSVRDLLGGAQHVDCSFAAFALVLGGEYARSVMGTVSPLPPADDLHEIVFERSPELFGGDVLVFSNEFWQSPREYAVLKALARAAGTTTIGTMSRVPGSATGPLVGAALTEFLGATSLRVLAAASQTGAGGATVAAWFAGVSRAVRITEHSAGGDLFRAVLTRVQYPPSFGVLWLPETATVFGMCPRGMLQVGSARRLFYWLYFLCQRCVSVADPGTVNQDGAYPVVLSPGERSETDAVPEQFDDEQVPEDFAGLKFAFAAFAPRFESTLAAVFAVSGDLHWLGGATSRVLCSWTGMVDEHITAAMAAIDAHFTPFQYLETGPFDYSAAVQPVFPDVTSGNYRGVLPMVWGTARVAAKETLPKTAGMFSKVELVVRNFNARLSGLTYAMQASTRRAGATLCSVHVVANPFGGNGESGVLTASGMDLTNLAESADVEDGGTPVPSFLGTLGGPSGLVLHVNQTSAVHVFVGAGFLDFFVSVEFSRLVRGAPVVAQPKVTSFVTQANVGSLNRLAWQFRGLSEEAYNGGEGGYTDLLRVDMGGFFANEPDDDGDGNFRHQPSAGGVEPAELGGRVAVILDESGRHLLGKMTREGAAESRRHSAHRPIPAVIAHARAPPEPLGATGGGWDDASLASDNPLSEHSLVEDDTASAATPPGVAVSRSAPEVEQSNLSRPDQLDVFSAIMVEANGLPAVSFSDASEVSDGYPDAEAFGEVLEASVEEERAARDAARPARAGPAAQVADRFWEVLRGAARKAARLEGAAAAKAGRRSVDGRAGASAVAAARLQRLAESGVPVPLDRSVVFDGRTGVFSASANFDGRAAAQVAHRVEGRVAHEQLKSVDAWLRSPNGLPRDVSDRLAGEARVLINKPGVTPREVMSLIDAVHSAL